MQCSLGWHRTFQKRLQFGSLAFNARNQMSSVEITCIKLIWNLQHSSPAMGLSALKPNTHFSAGICQLKQPANNHIRQGHRWRKGTPLCKFFFFSFFLHHTQARDWIRMGNLPPVLISFHSREITSLSQCDLAASTPKSKKRTVEERRRKHKRKDVNACGLSKTRAYLEW